MVAKTTTKKNKSKKKKAQKVKQGKVFIQSSYNNTIVSVADLNGNVLVWSSAGRVGFSGARKSTPFAAQQVIKDIAQKLEPYGMEDVRVLVKGIGNARESAVRSLASAGLNVIAIRDITPIPHNGVRARKRRRV